MKSMKISETQASILASVSASMFLWGIVASIGPLAASGSLVGRLPPYLKTFILLLGPAAGLLGDSLFGFLSDRAGRKKIFAATMMSYGLGLLVISASTYADSFLGLAAGLALAELGVEGEMAPSLSLMTEDFPISSRAFYLTLATDMSNLGASFIAGLLLVSPSVSYAYIIVGSGIGLLAVLTYARLKMPESFRWLRQAGISEEADSVREKLVLDQKEESITHPGYLIPMISLVLMGLSQYLTYGLMAFIIGPYEFPQSSFDQEIILYANLGATLGGILSAYLINLSSRRWFASLSFAGGLLTTLWILALSSNLSDPFVFFPLLFLNMIMSEFAWTARLVLEPESFPTKLRGTAIGAIRAFPIAAYDASIYLTSSFSVYQFVLFNLALWGLGLAGALLWLAKGFETKGISPDYAQRHRGAGTRRKEEEKHAQ